MKPQPAHPLPPALDTAVLRLKQAAAEAAQRTVESLGLAALSAASTKQREVLLGSQHEFGRKQDAFTTAFDQALDESLLRELGQRVALDSRHNEPAEPPDTAWASLRLVDDGEVEERIVIDRFALAVAHGCEWELREVEAYIGALSLPKAKGKASNPLRPELVGQALFKAIASASDRDEVRKLLQQELGRSFGTLLRAAYADMVNDWRSLGLQPVSLTVRRQAHAAQSSSRALAGTGPGTGPEPSADPQPTGREAPQANQAQRGPAPEPARGSAWQPWADEDDIDTRYAGPGAWGNGVAQQGMHSDVVGSDVGNDLRSNVRNPTPNNSRSARAQPMGAVGPRLMSLIRQLSFDAAHAAGTPGSETDVGLQAVQLHEPEAGGGAAFGAQTQHNAADGLARWSLAPANMIHAHRDALHSVANGAVDHLVIDVVGVLFDQILADPKVPPQMARLLARLQLPVLRAALGDAAFFSTRKHPVRRFVNRMAALSAGFEDFASAKAQTFLAKAAELVGEIIDGDFEQLSLYDNKLALLEAFVVDQQALALQAQGNQATQLVAEKEDEFRLQQLYAQQLAADLRDVAVPGFLIDFLSQVWSRVLVRAQVLDARGVKPSAGNGTGPNSAATTPTPPTTLSPRLTPLARDLVHSIQPKITQAQRNELLSQLPVLMRTLTEGLDLVAWPQNQRETFFAQLMPAHADALKTSNARQLDVNLNMRLVDSALAKPMPSAKQLAAAPRLQDAKAGLETVHFSADEAHRAGLLDESAVHWGGAVDIDTAQQPPDPAQDLPALPGLPALDNGHEAHAPSDMADQVQIGFAYEMNTAGAWQRVKLSHVSPGRSFFIFLHGKGSLQTMSLTARMLLRLCQAKRFRSLTTEDMVGRAAQRARHQLAKLAAP